MPVLFYCLCKLFYLFPGGFKDIIFLFPKSYFEFLAGYVLELIIAGHFVLASGGPFQCVISGTPFYVN